MNLVTTNVNTSINRTFCYVYGVDLEPNTVYEVRVLAETKVGAPSLDVYHWPWVKAKTDPNISEGQLSAVINANQDSWFCYFSR